MRRLVVPFVFAGTAAFIASGLVDIDVRFADGGVAHAGIAIWPTGEQALANCLRTLDLAAALVAAEGLGQGEAPVSPMASRSGADSVGHAYGPESSEAADHLLRLDVALEAAFSFLDVLRAHTLEDVESKNVELTEQNLELARRREAVGFSP